MPQKPQVVVHEKHIDLRQYTLTITTQLYA